MQRGGRTIESREPPLSICLPTGGFQGRNNIPMFLHTKRGGPARLAAMWQCSNASTPR